MSIHYLPDGYTALRSVPGSRYDVQHICTDTPDMLSVVRVYHSNGYTALAKNGYAANGNVYVGDGNWDWNAGRRYDERYPDTTTGYIAATGTRDIDPPEEWPFAGSYFPLFTYDNDGKLFDTPCNVKVVSIRIQSDGSVGTPESGADCNLIGQPAGVGCSFMWEFYGDARESVLPDARIKIVRYNGITGTTELVSPPGGYKLYPDSSESDKFVDLALHATNQQPIDVLINLPDGVVLSNDDGSDMTLQLFDRGLGGSTDLEAPPGLIFAPITLTIYYELLP